MDVNDLRFFMGPVQRMTLIHATRGAEAAHFRKVLNDLAHLIAKMPTVGSRNRSNAPEVAHLHYFMGTRHWYVVERDSDFIQQQAYGVRRWGSEDPDKAGYIPLNVLLDAGAELDLHFQPTPVDELRRNWLQE